MAKAKRKTQRTAKTVTGFRLSESTLDTMDRLLTNPPPIAFDGDRGAARNRTELIELLVRHAAQALAGKEKSANPDLRAKR